MKEFNLNEYLKDPSKKVVTRDGRAVRIICTDAKGDEPIIALVYNNNRDEENVYTYNRDGSFYRDNYDCLDLFFKSSTNTNREGWINLFKDEDIVYLTGIIHDSEEDARKAIKGDPEFIATIKIEWEE